MFATATNCVCIGEKHQQFKVNTTQPDENWSAVFGALVCVRPRMVEW